MNGSRGNEASDEPTTQASQRDNPLEPNADEQAGPKCEVATHTQTPPPAGLPAPPSAHQRSARGAYPGSQGASAQATVDAAGPAHDHSTSQRGWWIAALIGVPILVGALVGVAYALGQRGSDVSSVVEAPSGGSESQPTPESNPTTAMPSTAAPVRPIAPATVTTRPQPTQPPSTTQPAVVATVNRTCGDDGAGDCFLALRDHPGSSGTELARLDEGAQVRLACQARGEGVLSSVLGYHTDVWARDLDGRWMSMAFLDAPGWSLSDLTVPC